MAETLTVRNFSIYGKNGRKYDYATNGTLTINNNGQQLIGDGQWLGVSKGVPTSTFTCDNIISVGGNEATQQAADAVMDQTYIDMSFGIVDGRIYSAKMSANECSFETNMAEGSLTGKFSFSGGKPEKVS